MIYTEAARIPRIKATNGGFFHSLVERYNEWRAYRRTRAELASMSNLELADMGIGRCEIEFIARGGVRKV